MKRADLIAGISVAGLMLPEAVAYAGIAGLAPGRAVIAAIVGALAYTLAGRSRFAIVTTTSSSAAILAAALAQLPGGAAEHGLYATLAVAMAAILFLIAAALRLGGLTGFIARPVLRGFSIGLGITIILKQMPILVGVSLPAAATTPGLAAELLLAMPRWHPASIAVGAAALAAILLLRRRPGLPGALIVLTLGILASRLLDLPAHGVATIGTIAIRPDWPAGFAPAGDDVSRLAQWVAPLTLILFAESWGTMRALALVHGDRIAPGRELAALGIANLASALAQGMPVGAGFSAGAASEAAGAQTRATAVVAAIGLALLVAFATPLIARLPHPVLSAVVIAALTHALDPTPFLRLWKLGRDQYVALAAAVGVLMFGVLDGMLIAIALSIAAMVRRLATPSVIGLGRLDASHDFVDLARHPDARPVPGIAIWRPAEPLFFANAERVLGDVEERLRAAPGLRAAVLSLEESFDIDSSALDALIEFDRRITGMGLELRLARVHDRVRELLLAAGEDALARSSSYSVDDAVAALAATIGKAS